MDCNGFEIGVCDSVNITIRANLWIKTSLSKNVINNAHVIITLSFDKYEFLKNSNP